MTVTLEAPQEARYRSGGATGGIRGKKAAGDGSRGQSARKRGLGRPQGRQRARRRSRGSGRGVKSGGATGLGLCERAAGERRGDGVCRHGRRPGGGAGGAATAPAARKKASLCQVPVFRKKHSRNRHKIKKQGAAAFFAKTTLNQRCLNYYTTFFPPRQ